MTDLLVVFGLGAPYRGNPTILGKGIGGHTVRLASDQGLAVRAVARSVTKYESSFAGLKNVTLVQGDVTSRESVHACLQGAKYCLFAAHASQPGVQASRIAKDALSIVAEECLEAKCKLVVISSCLVSPKHRFNPIRGFFNAILKPGMMDAKFAGEEFLRKLEGLDYVVIRPGSLSDGAELKTVYKIGQSDTMSFALLPIPKIDVAKIVLAAFQDEQCTRMTMEVAASFSKAPATLKGLFDGLKRDS